jgi:hypothetical protein
MSPHPHRLQRPLAGRASDLAVRQNVGAPGCTPARFPAGAPRGTVLRSGLPGRSRIDKAMTSRQRPVARKGARKMRTKGTLKAVTMTAVKLMLFPAKYVLQRSRTFWEPARRFPFSNLFQIYPSIQRDRHGNTRADIEEKYAWDSTGYLREDRDPLYTQKVGGPNPSPHPVRNHAVSRSFAASGHRFSASVLFLSVIQQSAAELSPQSDDPSSCRLFQHRRCVRQGRFFRDVSSVLPLLHQDRISEWIPRHECSR